MPEDEAIEQALEEIRLLTSAEVAKSLGLSTRTLERMRKRRERGDAETLAFVRVAPGKIGYRVSDVKEFLERMIVLGPGAGPGK